MSRREAPATGIQVWAQPDPSAAPFTTVGGGQSVEVLEETATGWARVRLASGHEGWVDGRQLVAPPAPAPPAQSGGGRRPWVIAGLALVLVASGIIVAVLATQGDDTPDTVVAVDPTAEEPTDEPSSETPTDDAPDQEAPAGGSEPADEPSGEPPTSDEPLDSFTFSDELVDRAIATAAAGPPAEGLPSRDEITAARLTRELVDAGVDVTGIEILVYPASSADSIVFLGTNDSTPLLNSDDEEGADAFLLSLFDSPALTEAGIQRVVLQHMGEDDDGPLVFTLTALLSDLRTAVETDGDASESIAVQVERP